MEDKIAKYIESVQGFRYHPTDEELMLALKSMILGTYDLEHGVILQFDVCEHEPWDLASLIDEKSKFKSSNNKEWYCFNRQTKRYKNSKRCTRATTSGYWKTTGKKRDVISDDNELMGFKQTLVFHEGHANKGFRTGWVIHEYSLAACFLGDNSLEGTIPFVVCRLKYKRDKKGANFSSSTYQEENAINNIHDIPVVTTETEVEENLVCSHAIPISSTTQVADNTSSSSSVDPSNEEWEELLSQIIVSPSHQDMPLWEDIDETFLEVDDLSTGNQH